LALIIARLRSAVLRLEDAHEALNQRTIALLEARDEANRANRSKTEFLAQMSHDLRTPLNAILGFSEVIALQTFGTDGRATERYREYARHIHTGGAHLRALIDSILDIARLDSGRYEIHRNSVDLDALFGTCVTMMREQIDQKRIEVKCPTSGLQVRADPSGLEQILLNVLGNAVKYSSERGTITLTGLRTPTGVEISVADTGPGMGSEDLEHAFDLFSRGSALLARSTEGTGIGLSIVKRLVDLHGGTVRIESGTDTGTIVTITLPDGQTEST
jgi:signal transduction histidine kinase